jgi:cytoskeletal protein CcmA (bactofilin family)
MADRETILGPGIRISGEVRGDENLLVRGRVDGTIHLTEQLTVDEGAIVQANVDVRTLIVAGTLVGTILASESVRLLSTARVVGNLTTPRVAMEAGAAYRGRVEIGEIKSAQPVVAGRPAVATLPVARPAQVEPAPTVASARPAPPRLTSPAKAATVPTKVAPKLAAPAPRPAPHATVPPPASPPSMPRVAGTASGPAWAKKKLRRR